MFKLSICIPTLNRAQYIGETLDSIVPDLRNDVEVVIVDGGSSDQTEAVVATYRERFASIRYIRRSNEATAPTNSGFDRDCSWAVELAQGEYCWLMTDDDVLVPGAVRRVVERLGEGHELIVISCEVRDPALGATLVQARPRLAHDMVFQPAQWEAFFSLTAMHLTFVGAVVVRRVTWLSRHPEAFFGSGFVHVGVIFSAPMQETVLVIAQPLVLIRYGNGQWTQRAFEIFIFDWPRLIWSFPGIRDSVKKAVIHREPWRVWRVLLLQRAYGRYALEQYNSCLRSRMPSALERIIARSIAMIPLPLLYVPAWIYGHTRRTDPRFFLFTLNAAMRQRRETRSLRIAQSDSPKR